MSEQNPYQPTSPLDRTSRRGSRGRIAVSISFAVSVYFAVAVGFSALMIGGICFLDEQGLFFIPGLDENVAGFGVCAVALVCGGCGAMLCSQILRFELASSIAVFAIANTFVGFVWAAAFTVLGFFDSSIVGIFPRSSDSLVPAHHLILGFAALGGVFGIGAVVKEIHDERPLLAMVRSPTSLTAKPRVFPMIKLTAILVAPLIVWFVKWCLFDD